MEQEEKEEEKPEVSTNQASRLSAHEIFSTVTKGGRDELRRPLAGLGISALAGGITIGLSALAMALMADYLGDTPVSHLLQAAVYPVGFIAVIIGRAQFFTENTLFPVITYLDSHISALRLIAFWGVVLGGNLIGTWFFALLVIRSGALQEATRQHLFNLGLQAAAPPFWDVFWSAVIAGWLMALVAWMVSASRWTSGQILVTWLITLLIGLGHFAHCVASSAEVLSAVVGGRIGVGPYWAWLAPAVLGNLGGGVVIVSLLNYGQVKAGERE